MTWLVLVAVLQQTPPPPPPGNTAATPLPPAEATAPSPTEPAEVRAFAAFVERRLLSLDPEPMQGFFRVRQRERTASLRDDDFPDMFKLVPEAQTLALKAQENMRSALSFTIAGIVCTGVGLAAVAIAPFLISSGGFLVLLLGALVVELVGLALVLIALPFMSSGQEQFLSSVSVYNKGLLDLRPAATGLTIPLPLP